jgi:hypothetical protein
MNRERTEGEGRMCQWSVGLAERADPRRPGWGVVNNLDVIAPISELRIIADQTELTLAGLTLVVEWKM